MSELTGARFVLAVADLAASRNFYIRVLGFEEEAIHAPGWAFLRRDAVRLMLGECPDAPPAGTLGDHAWFAQIEVRDIHSLYEKVRGAGGTILAELAERPWGMTEFCLRTIDGQRIVFAELTA
ncbi:MAG TPA: VOC family protein [Pirellulales bacterium]|nr:VOC family protein [Pirellulales bacterium]